MCDEFFSRLTADEQQSRCKHATEIAEKIIYCHANQVSTSNILNDAIKAPSVKNDNEVYEFVTLWMFSLMHEMFLNKWDATEVLLTISKVIENIEHFQYINPVVVILSKCIGIAPLSSLKDLLKLCLNICNRGFIHFIIKQCLKINLLNWILYPSVLTNDCIDVVYELYNVLNTPSDEIIDKNESTNHNRYILLYQNTNQQLHFIIEVCQLLEDKEHLDANIMHILKYANNSPLLFLKHTYIFIAGIFLCDYNEDIISKCLYLLLKYVSVNNEIASNVLTLILYKLANTRDSKIHFELLKAIPKMGIVKENIQIILSTLHVLASSSTKMKTFTMYLFYELWCSDTRYYLYLQKLLIEDNPSDKANFVVTKAHILKELCKRKPELYGSELATHLSKILNTCKNDDGIASSLALEGLRYLCTGGVIDIVTAWETLAPSFETENRENVIQSFCNLLSEVPNLYTDAAKYDEMISDIVNKLWNYTMNYTNIEIVKAAYETLSCFSHEQVSRYFPEIYRDDAGDRDATADVLVLASGEWWLSMLKNGNYAHFECITKFISNWVRKEISEYGKGVYFMSENRAEPRDYYYLQIYSIVKALLKHIKLKYKNESEIEIACLNILSQEYSKSLPPCDWSFLHELVHIPQYRKYCVLIASHQVILSGTARRFMENFLTAITEKPNEEDILTTVLALKSLCNSIQPIIMKPFVELSINFALERIKEDNDSVLYDEIIAHFKIILCDKDIHEVNKSVIGKLIVETIQDMPISSENFRKLLDCLILLPFKYIKELISPKCWPEITQYNFRRAVLTRCAIARNCEESPMVWFNEIIDVSGDLKGDQLFVLQHVSKAMEKCKGNISTPNWILELLGQTQVYMVDANQFTNQVAFMCDVLMISMLTMSSHVVFLNPEDDINMERMMFLFPQAMAAQLKNDNWNSNALQVLEWLHYMINFEEIPDDYKKCFYQTLISLRHEPMFKESLKWLKYVGCRF
ncbi:hypothetical protein AMK59_769, partial [Oryctes borbonicus]